jgi:hypothetical protein
MHWHVFSYVGHGADIGPFDHTNRSPDGSGFVSSPHPPFFVSHWLHKPKSASPETFTIPEAAVEWLAMAFVEAHTDPARRPWPSVEARHAGAVEQLAMGNDVCWSNWVSSSRLAQFYAVSCPPPGGRARCPEGRPDGRPQEGSTAITGVP